MNKQTDWWFEFFREFRPVFDNIPQKQTNALVRFVSRKLHLKAGKSFLDCPCGIGRVALPMARQGIRVTGVDITADYLRDAAVVAHRRKLKLNLVHSDMRRINFNSQFDAAGNLWTSFGYFQNESDNLLVLKKMYKALKPGGRFALQLVNRDWVMANFLPSSWFTAGEVRILETREIDYATSTSHDTWRFIRNGVEEERHFDLRLYSYHELRAMFTKVGFVDIEGYGSIKEDPITRDTRMMFLFATRPKA